AIRGDREGDLRSCRKHAFLSSFCAAGLLLTATTAFAQTSSVSGTVKDPSGAVVGSALVKLTEPKTAVHRESLTGETGEYTFKDVVPGDYTVEVSAPGFDLFSAKISVSSEPATVNISMQVASAAASVSVQARIDPYNVVPESPTQSIFGFDQKLEDIP